MPILFITLSESYAEIIQHHGFEAKVMKIQDYIPNPSRRTYYVSPANSLCFMDGGIDYALSRIIFPGVESEVKQRVRELGIENLLGRLYLPIGSSLILDKGKNRSLIVSPTMLLPQNVSSTNNAYYCTMSVLYNILENRGERLEDIDILFTSFCCGYGKMDESESIRQIMLGIENYKYYSPRIVDKNTIVREPNLEEQPKYYQNTEFFSISPNELVRC
jgi:O-acetyl-ADP-ribose deacetylase (regulator of RNase III)